MKGNLGLELEVEINQKVEEGRKWVGRNGGSSGVEMVRREWGAGEMRG